MKFRKQTQEQKDKSKQKKERRTRIGIKSKLKEIWNGLGQQAGGVLFVKLWDCPDLTELEAQERGVKKKIISIMKLKYKNKMPGYRYKQLILAVKQFTANHAKKIVEAEVNEMIRKEVKDFYAYKGLKKRARHLTKQEIAKHIEIQSYVETILGLTEAGAFRKKDKDWMNKVLLEDLKTSEIKEKQKMMQEFGLT